MSNTVHVQSLPHNLVICIMAGITIAVDARELKAMLEAAYTAGVSVGELVPQEDRPYLSFDTQGMLSSGSLGSILGGPCDMNLNFPSLESAVEFKLRKD